MIDDQVRDSLSNQAHLTRGVIINHYATIEFGIDELIYRARRDPAYNALIKSLTIKDRIPHELSDKIELCRRIFESEGPLSKFSHDVILAIDALSEFTELRNLAAHGLMRIDLVDGNPFLSFTKFTQKKNADRSGTDCGYSKVVFDEHDVRYVTGRLSLYARTVIQTLAGAIAGADLPDLFEPDAEDEPGSA